MNNTTNINDYLILKAKLINNSLEKSIPSKDVPPLLSEAMRYSLFAGGKRIRPILAMATYESFGKSSEDILQVVINLELLHTYSLIHDDLPAMDNDDYRRGKLTNHKIFGDAIAILAGDALLTYAFGNMAKELRKVAGLDLDTGLQLIEEFALYTGAKGMVGGQIVDLLANIEETSFDDLKYIHTHKTGDLILFSIRLGAILAKANKVQLEGLTKFGRNIGLAFQIQDDILDIIGDSNKLGKSVGSDEVNQKVTYPFFKGIDESKREVEKLTREAIDAVKGIDINTKILYDLADYLIFRDN